MPRRQRPRLDQVPVSSEGLATVHENAAKCLESGKPHKDCQAQLEKECKGLGIGKYCGMKHKH